jgi:hypothetical protein
MGPLVQDLLLCELGFVVRSVDVCLGIGGRLEERRGVRDDGAIGRDELDYEFGFATRGVGQNKMQIANLVGFQIPFSIAIGAPRRQRAALWQPAYGDDAAGGHSISTVKGNWEDYLLADCRFERGRRREDCGRDCRPGRWHRTFVRRKCYGP